MTSPEYYSLDRIQQSLLTEHPAQRGISPDVYAQNTLINRLIAVGAEMYAPNILGCQIIGSRIQGSAGLESDLDMAIISYQDQKSVADMLGDRLLTVLLPAGIETDWHFSPALRGVRSILPSEPGEFVARVEQDPVRAISMYEVGVYDTTGLRLGALAASEVIRSLHNTQEAWKALRHHYIGAYLGDRERVCNKLAVRLGLPQLQVGQYITPELWEERVRRFALPESFDDCYGVQLAWLEGADIPETHMRSFILYEQVRDQRNR